MGTTAIEQTLREQILREPDVILDDLDVMRALVSATDSKIGDNVVDFRGIAMQRLEARLDRLEETHHSVIAAAYENVAGANTVQRAVLQLLDPADFISFLAILGGPVTQAMRVPTLRLVLETDGDRNAVNLNRVANVLGLAEMGFASDYVGAAGCTPRQVTLRQIENAPAEIHGTDAPHIRSEACVMLDLGSKRLPGLLVLGSRSPDQFAQGQGTDLLAFFGGVVQRCLRRWLA